MSRISQVQQDFQDFLLQGAAGVERHLTGSERVPVATRLGIYSAAYGARLTEALQANYPALHQLLGESDFEMLAAAYIRTHPSSFASIRHYGHALEQFLTQDPKYAAVPILPELARWEWAMTETFDAADAPAVKEEAVASVPAEGWPALRFGWHPSVRRLQLLWNVPQIWSAITQQTAQPEPSLAARPQQWMIWRRDAELEIYFRSLPPSEAAALDAARAGASFAEVCGELCSIAGEAAAPGLAAQYLRGWLQSGLIVEVRQT